jgi:arginine deiminase
MNAVSGKSVAPAKVASKAADKAAMSVEEQLRAAQAEIARLQELAREEATKSARFPWENPDIIQAQPRMGYNFKMEPELYLKVKWIVENVGGMKSMQVFLDRAANEMADAVIDRFTKLK